MASLTLGRWERWTPDWGDNREKPEGEAYQLEIYSGLSKVALARLQEFPRQASLEGVPPEQLEEARAAAELAYAREVAQHLSVAVRLGPKPLTLDGQEVTELQHLVAALVRQAGLQAWLELVGAVLAANSLGADRQGFSVRPSGGTSGTPLRSGARASAPTAAP